MRTPTEPGARVHLGTGPGRAIHARQRRGDGSGIEVARGGFANATDRFVVEMTLRSPRGRERGMLEIQACPSGVAFGQPTCTTRISPTWLDLSTNGVVASETITGLQPNRAYSWRARTRFTAYTPAQPPATARTRVGPWFRLQGQVGTGEIRTAVPEPGIGRALAMGLVFLAARLNCETSGR